MSQTQSQVSNASPSPQATIPKYIRFAFGGGAGYVLVMIMTNICHNLDYSRLISFPEC